jgi:hypothetical protein
MIARELRQSDLLTLNNIYQKHYSDDFHQPEFHKEFTDEFVITDDHDKIIIGAGIRPILESVILTDKDCSEITRVRALIRCKEISSYITRKNGFKQLFAVAVDEHYKMILIKYGFQPVRGTFLVLDL